MIHRVPGVQQYADTITVIVDVKLSLDKRRGSLTATATIMMSQDRPRKKNSDTPDSRVGAMLPTREALFDSSPP